MKTFFPKKEEIERKWYIVDVKGKVLGRVCSEITKIIRGKHKPIYTPYLDVGDFVVVINAGSVKLTGKKLDNKIYYRYSGYPGGIKAETARFLLKNKPEKLIRLAIKGMLPKNRLGRKLLKHVKIYRDENHPHIAQKPLPLDI